MVVPPSVWAAGFVADATATADLGWQAWATSPTDPSRQLLPLTPASNTPTDVISVATADRRQTWLGSGGALTDASATLLHGDSTAERLLFDPTRPDGAHLNLVRLPSSATDFSTSAWTFGWNDSTAQLTVPPQATTDTAVLTSEIVPLRRDLQVVATPWTAPASMKDSGRLQGGNLLASSVDTYGRMLVAQAKWLLGEGVPLRAITLGNEPFYNTTSYPSMAMTDDELVRLGDGVSSSLAASGVELWAVDHNWADRSHYDTVEGASPGVYARSAFHCYGGVPSEMSGVGAPPIVTECTGTTDAAAGTFRWDATNLVTAAVDAGSTGLLMWNLTLDQNHGPHNGGCADCRGVIDIDTATAAITKNAEFFTLAQLARAADPGAKYLAPPASPACRTSPSSIPTIRLASSASTTPAPPATLRCL